MQLVFIYSTVSKWKAKSGDGDLSTATNLTIYVDDILNGMYKSDQIDAIYTDFAKAFYRVNHRLLIRKLQLLGIDDFLLE